jgi:hypothetical protein
MMACQFDSPSPSPPPPATVCSHAAMATDPDASSFRPATFLDLISSELVLISITAYLPVDALLALAATNREIREAMFDTPGVWRTIDLSEMYYDLDTEALVRFFRKPFISRDCRQLILDGLLFDHEFLDQILTREMSQIVSISLVSCPNLNGDQLVKLIDYLRRPSAPRPLQLRHMALLGAPLFPLNQPSVLAPTIVAAAGLEIETDLHSGQCFGKDHIYMDQLEGRWHLKVKFPDHPCVECRRPQELCMKCHVKKTCVGCHAYYCEDCEPFPNVHSPPCP